MKLKRKVLIIGDSLGPGWVRTRSGGKNADLSIGYVSKKFLI